LPDALGVGAFTVAEARSAGVSSRRLRNRALHRPTKAVRSVQAPDTLVLQAAALARVLHAPWAFSHLTAARLHALPLPTMWSAGERLHVMYPSDTTRVRRSSAVGHMGLESRYVTTVHGLPVTSALDTWMDLAAMLRVDDLVVCGDVVVARDPLARGELSLLLSARRGARGRRTALAALDLIRPGSASPMESRARLAFFHGGLPEPELNAPIWDSAGEWVATADFVWRAERVIVEYEGDQHRTDRRQWQADLARTRLLESLGWKVIRMSAQDLSPQRVAGTIALIAAALSR
jgi:hypothetical protein